MKEHTSDDLMSTLVAAVFFTAVAFGLIGTKCGSSIEQSATTNQIWREITTCQRSHLDLYKPLDAHSVICRDPRTKQIKILRIPNSQ